jgi:hypothetical protein
MNRIIPFLISIFFLACSENQTDYSIQSQEEVSVPINLSVKTLEGNWKIALKSEGDWYWVKGCDEYAVSIQDAYDEFADGHISMSDRIGLSVGIQMRVIEQNYDENRFSLTCESKIDENEKMSFAGLYHETKAGWLGPVIELEKCGLWDIIEYESGFEAHVIEGMMLYLANDEGTNPSAVSEYDCDLGFENDAAEFIPVGGLTEENFTEYIAALLVSNVYLEGGILEGDYIYPVSFGEFFLIVVDRQWKGEVIDVLFYSIDKDGNLLDEVVVTGAFKWFENDMIFKKEQDGRILCVSKEANEETGEEVVNEIRVWIDNVGMIKTN